MTQYGRPDSDIVVNGWLPSSGSLLYPMLDEAVPADTDYIQRRTSSNDTCTIGLSNVTDPETGSGHTVRIRARRDNGTIDYTLNIELLQESTVIASWIETFPDSWTTFTNTLTESQANSITDYTALRLRPTVTNTSGFGTAYAQISWAEFECPDLATTGHAGTAVNSQPLKSKMEALVA